MSCNIPRPILTHAQRVCRFYKKALRAFENQYFWRKEFRYQAVLLRKRFDDTRQEKDMRKLAIMLNEAEDELFLNWSHPAPFQFKNSPGGITYKRGVEPMMNDIAFDFWHPWEKAPYIDYFEKREKRKDEYKEYFEKSIMNKGYVDLEKAEFPMKEPPKL